MTYIFSSMYENTYYIRKLTTMPSARSVMRMSEELKENLLRYNYAPPHYRFRPEQLKIILKSAFKSFAEQDWVVLADPNRTRTIQVIKNSKRIYTVYWHRKFKKSRTPIAVYNSNAGTLRITRPLELFAEENSGCAADIKVFIVSRVNDLLERMPNAFFTRQYISACFRKVSTHTPRRNSIQFLHHIHDSENAKTAATRMRTIVANHMATHNFDPIAFSYQEHEKPSLVFDEQVQLLLHRASNYISRITSDSSYISMSVSDAASIKDKIRTCEELLDISSEYRRVGDSISEVVKLANRISSINEILGSIDQQEKYADIL